MVAATDRVTGLQAPTPPLLDPLRQAAELGGPTPRAAVDDGRRRGEALAHGRTPVVGQTKRSDQLVVELVIAEPLEVDGAADDVGVFERHPLPPHP